MSHLAIDLGSTKRKSHLVQFDPDNPREYRHGSFSTTVESIQELCQQLKPQVVIIECCRSSTWVHDVFRAEGVEVFVANTNDPAFWNNARRTKTDRTDAKRLMDLYLDGRLKHVHVPSPLARQERSLLDQRKRYQGQATQQKNAIKSLLDHHGIAWRTGRTSWSGRAIKELRRLAAEGDQPWRAQLLIEVDMLCQIQDQIARMDTLLHRCLEMDHQAQLLMKIRGVGTYTALATSASLDDPNRFQKAKQVSKYSGLSPGVHQSGKTVKPMGINRSGWSTLRCYLMEAAQVGIFRCREAWFVRQYEQLRQRVGRKKKAICAVARRLYVICWRMLCTGETWESLTCSE